MDTSLEPTVERKCRDLRESDARLNGNCILRRRASPTTFAEFVSQTYENFPLNVSPSNHQNQVWGMGKYASALRAGVRIGPGFPRGEITMASDVYKIDSSFTKFHGSWANVGRASRTAILD